ncbi:hypothetical protein BofuT4_uP086250.1 [Botrytis cinerea T4]|uniref:Uncharacterized protein n=1 Tax=Botryotinia fuckeliana (strain T4) TaxID=999810 RepID=G2YGE8_BOTF4|nr:hypothetical protein BofuT4_uP086250.1 [Botrytis cinerea T4]
MPWWMDSVPALLLGTVRSNSKREYPFDSRQTDRFNSIGNSEASSVPELQINVNGKRQWARAGKWTSLPWSWCRER